MPGEAGGIRAQVGLGCEGERAAVKVGEFEVRAAGEDGLGDVGLGHADTEVVIYGPEAGVEEIAVYRGKDYAFLRAVKASLRVGVDVGGA